MWDFRRQILFSWKKIFRQAKIYGAIAPPFPATTAAVSATMNRLVSRKAREAYSVAYS